MADGPAGASGKSGPRPPLTHGAPVGALVAQGHIGVLGSARMRIQGPQEPEFTKAAGSFLDSGRKVLLSGFLRCRTGRGKPEVEDGTLGTHPRGHSATSSLP